MASSKFTFITNYFKLAVLLGISDGLNDYMDYLNTLRSKLETEEDLAVFISSGNPQHLEELRQQIEAIKQEIEAYEQPLEFYSSIFKSILSFGQLVSNSIGSFFSTQENFPEDESADHVKLYS